MFTNMSNFLTKHFSVADIKNAFGKNGFNTFININIKQIKTQLSC